MTIVVVPRPPSGLGAHVHAALVERTLAVARAHSGERVAVAVPGRPATEGLDGPLVVVTTDVPRLGAVHFAIAEHDLDEGADASFGPTHDGGYYMAAMREPREELLALEPAGWVGASGFARTRALAQSAGLEVGLLRMERRLDDTDDAAALLADPLLPAAIRSALDRP